MGDTEFIIEPGQQDLVITRTFDAPRDAVFAAVTNPDLIPNWWGPRSVTTKVDEMDLRRGGTWQFRHTDRDGTEVTFHGVYHEVTAPERVVQTFEFDGAPGHVVLETLTLDEVDGRTRYRTRSVFESLEDRDMAVASGMESGARETIERLAEIIEGR